MSNKHFEELDALFADLDLDLEPAKSVPTTELGHVATSQEAEIVPHRSPTSYTNQLISAAFGGLKLGPH